MQHLPATETATSMIPAPIQTAQYLNLATFRKNGLQVNTPVWFADDGQALYVFSAGNAGKVKRLKNSSNAKIAPCKVNGTLTGAWLSATAHILSDEAEIQHALHCLLKKYDWQLKVLNFFSRVTGKIDHRAFIKIQLKE